MNPDTSPLGPATKAIFLEGRDLSTHDAEDLAHAAFASIDTDQLADVIAKHYAIGYLPDTGTECDCGEHLAGRDERYQDNHESHIAQAVKNWLTGKDTQ